MSTPTYPDDLLLVKPLKFLGATVLSMNASLGLGTANSSLNLNLILDCDDNDYFAPYLLSTDPNYVKVGDAVYFRIAKISPDIDISNPCSFLPENIIFQFGGVLTSWTANKGNGGLTYSVKVDDPRILLENTAIIVDTFSDIYNRGGYPISTINTITNSLPEEIYKKYNYINLYQYFEGEVHNGKCSVFGTAGVLENAGMPYNKIIEGLKALDMPIYASTHDIGTDKSTTKYYIQWSDLEIADVPNYFRINGNPKITMSSLLTEVADLIGAEYYVYLEEDGICSGRNLIRIGFIPLNNNPTSFSNIIDEYDAKGTATELSYGQELRAEKTKTILIGSNVHRIAEYQGGINGTIPFFGFDEPDKDPETNELPLDDVPVLPMGYDNNGFYISKKLTKLNSQLNVPLGAGKYLIHELDIRAALASCDAWLDRVMDNTIDNGVPNTLNGAIRAVFQQCIKSNREYWNAVANENPFNGLSPNATVRMLVDVLQNPKAGTVAAFKPGVIDDLEKIHAFILQLGQTYYAKQYLIPLTNIIGDNPLNNFIMCGYRNTYDTISGEWQFTAEPTTEGGWVDPGSPVLGLADPYLQMFRNEDGRINAFVRFTGGNCGFLDLSYLNDDEAIATLDSSIVYVKVDIESKILMLELQSNFYLDKFIKSLQLPGDPPLLVPCVIIKLPSPCLQACGNWTSPSWVSSLAKELNANFAQADPVQPQNEAAGNDKVNNAQNPVDITSLNNRGYMPAAVRPERIAIPLKFNNQVYGPWGSSGCFIDGGGVEVVQQTDLNPWTYGSVDTMTVIGSGLVSTMNRGLLKSETGSIKILGLPSVGNLGAALNSTGPTLSNISMSYGGSDGVTSTAEFKTYTPKFGTLNKIYVDRFKEYTKQRLEYLKKINNVMLNMHKLGRQMIVNQGGGRKSTKQFQAREGSLQRIIIGELTPSYSGTDSRQTRVGFETLYKSAAEMVSEYNKKSYMSLDAFFGPVSIFGEDGLPKLESLTVTYPGGATGSEIKSYTKAPQPPSWRGTSSGGAYNMNNLSVRALHLNPLTNPDTLTDRVDGGTHKGHVIDLVGRNETVPDKGLCNNILPQDDKEKYAYDYRLIAMRGPILLHGWGYDTQGKPIPSASGDDNLSESFAQDWLQKPQDWPVGPIDLRFDRDRKVWVSPPSHRIVALSLNESLSPHALAIGKLIKYGGAYPAGPNATVDGDQTVQVIDRLGCFYPSGSKVYAYFDTFDGNYIVLNKCSG
jgi:hypothetical protein